MCNHNANLKSSLLDLLMAGVPLGNVFECPFSMGIMKQMSVDMKHQRYHRRRDHSFRLNGSL